MRSWLPSLGVLVMGCADHGFVAIDGGPIDTAATVDGDTSSDSAPAPDGPVADAAADTDAALECNASSGALLRAIGGAPGHSVMLAINASFNAGDTDGVLGRITENGADLELTDVAVFSPVVAFAAGGGAIHQVAYPELGTFIATRLGDAPGITALAANGNTDLFGAAGLVISRITPSPFAVTPIAAITPPSGCTKILDFVAPLSGGDFVFQMLLDCGTTTRVTSVAWTPGTTTFRPAGQDLVGPPDAVGLNLSAMVTSDGKLYRWSTFGSGTLTLVRELSACLGTAPRGLQE
jgi:hypothetical protein